MNNNLPKFIVKEIIDNNDGTSSVFFEISDDDQERFMEIMGWSEWDNKKFNEFIVRSLEDLANKEKETTERNLKDPEFLWSQPSDK